MSFCRMTFCVGGLLLRLLPQRVDFEPGTSRKHQQFQGARVQYACVLGSTIGVDERGYFVLENQRENPAFPAGGRIELLHETLVQFGNRRSDRNAISDRAHHGGSAIIERKIFDSITVDKAAGLPSRGMAAFDDKESDSCGIASTGVEQGSQNLFLRSA